MPGTAWLQDMLNKNVLAISIDIMLQVKFDTLPSTLSDIQLLPKEKKMQENGTICCIRENIVNPIIISANKNIAEPFSGAIICHTTVWKQLMKFRYKTNKPIDSYFSRLI